MPENAAFTVRDGCVLCGFNCLADGEILMIACEYLAARQAFIREQDKVFQNIEQTVFLEDALKECVKLGKLRIFVATVLRFPFHIAVFARSDSACAVFGEVTHNADSIIDEHRRNRVHIVPDLRVGFGSVRFLTGRRFQLHKHHRQTVDEQQNIGALLVILDESPLIRHYKGVIVRICVVHKVADCRAFLAFVGVTDFNAVLQIVHKYSVFLHQLAVFKVLELKECIADRIIGERGIEPIECRRQLVHIQRNPIVTVDRRTVGVGVAHFLK